MCYYKNPGVDLNQRLRIIYVGQPAADIGGVVARQFFTDLLKNITDVYFQGDYFKLPVYNIATLSTLTVIGRITVHSILHEGPGLPVFSPAVFNYLVTQDTESTLNLLTIEDCSCSISYFIKKVNFKNVSINLIL